MISYFSIRSNGFIFNDFSNASLDLGLIFCYFIQLIKTYIGYWQTVTKLRFEWHRLLNISGNLIYRNDDEPTAYNQICSQSIQQAIKNYVITLILVILSALGAVPGPFYSYIHDGIYVTLFNLKLPYFNRFPSTEFLINITWETFNALIGIGIVFLMEFMIALCNDTISVSSQLTELSINELSDLLKQKKASKTKQILQLKKILMKVAHMDEYDQIFHTVCFFSSFIFVHCRFTKSFGNIMYIRNFVAPPSFTLSIAVSIYSQYIVCLLEFRFNSSKE